MAIKRRSTVTTVVATAQGLPVCAWLGKNLTWGDCVVIKNLLKHGALLIVYHDLSIASCVFKVIYWSSKILYFSFFQFSGMKNWIILSFLSTSYWVFLCLLTMGTGLGSQEDAVFSQGTLKNGASWKMNVLWQPFWILNRRSTRSEEFSKTAGRFEKINIVLLSRRARTWVRIL